MRCKLVGFRKTPPDLSLVADERNCNCVATEFNHLFRCRVAPKVYPISGVFSEAADFASQGVARLCREFRHIFIKRSARQVNEMSFCSKSDIAKRPPFKRQS